jgi:hypothetical protein
MATKHIKCVVNEKRQCFNDVNFRGIIHLFHIKQYFSYCVAVSCIDEENRSTRKNPLVA